MIVYLGWHAAPRAAPERQDRRWSARKYRETRKATKRVIESTDTPDPAGHEYAAPTATLYTADATAYMDSARPDETVKHSAAEYVGARLTRTAWSRSGTC